MGAPAATLSRAPNAAYHSGTTSPSPNAYAYTTPAPDNASDVGSVVGSNTSYNINCENLLKYPNITSTKHKMQPKTFKSIIPKAADGSPDSKYGAFVPDGFCNKVKNPQMWVNQGTHV